MIEAISLCIFFNLEYSDVLALSEGYVLFFKTPIVYPRIILGHLKIVLIQCLEPKASIGLWSEHFSLSRRVFSFRKLRHLKIVLIKQDFFCFQFMKFFKKLLIGK